MKTVPRRMICVSIAAVILLASPPAQAPLSALKKTDATDFSVLSDTSSSLVIRSPDGACASTVLSNSPVMFIENVGQFADSARFQVRGGDRSIWLAEDAIWVTVPKKPDKVTREQRNGEAFAPPIRDPQSAIQNQEGVNLKLSFVGANPHPRLEPFNRLDTRISYFTGNDPGRWHSDVPVWGGLRYVDLYPGIDLEITGQDGQWHWQIVAHDAASRGGTGPGGKGVSLRIDGAEAITLADAGRPQSEINNQKSEIHVTTAAGEFSLPFLQVAGETVARPTITTNQVDWAFASAMPKPRPLCLAQNLQSGASDLLYATFLGGSGDDLGLDITLDGSGAAYITGSTHSFDFPTIPGAFDTAYNGENDAFVAKLNAAGSALAYAAFLGGNGSDAGFGIATDESGAAYVTGGTSSPDFPTVPGAFDTTYNGSAGGDGDAFAVKLSAAGSALAYATFLGGSSDELGLDIAVDESGAAYVTGRTASSDFPTTPGAFDTTSNSDYDAFVAKLNAAGSALAYATFLGGSGYDAGAEIAVDGSNAAYVTGGTKSSNFPTTPGAFDMTHNGGDEDAFVVKLNTAGSALTFATFLGGSSYEGATGIAVGESGATYVTGGTWSSDFPTVPGAFDTIYNGGTADAFVVKLNAAGSALVYATFLGGGAVEFGRDIAVDRSEATFVTGNVGSSDFPTTPGAFDTVHNGGTTDAFVVRLNTAGSALVYATFLGGSGEEWGRGIAADGNGTAYVTGQTTSSDLPTTPGAYDRIYNGGTYDAFVAKLTMRGRPLTILNQVTPSEPRAVNFGDPLTYTLQIITPTDGALVFYNHVPTYTTYLAGSLNAPAGVVYDSPYNAISGTLSLMAFIPLTISFTVQVGITGTVGSAPLIVNRACVYRVGGSLADCVWSNEAWSFTYAWLTYLPLILRDR